jgi:seryl-tRNA synthetase
MLDIKAITVDPELFQRKLAEKGCKIDINEVIGSHKEYLAALLKVQNFQTEKNQIGGLIKKVDKKGDEFRELRNKIKTINDELVFLTPELHRIHKIHMNNMNNLPNILQDDVPLGKDELKNKLVYFKGTKPTFDFDIKDHIQLTQDPDNGLDFAKGSALAKSRFVVMNGKIAQLHRALGQYMLDSHVDAGYIEHNVPLIVKEEILRGTGQLPKFEDELFEVHGLDCGEEKAYLIPTAEVPLTNLVKDDRLNYKDLPINMTALTQCFRSEAGSYGRDAKGLIRQHQFEKVELVKIVRPEESGQALEDITAQAEFILNELQLPYRKVLLCSGDTGFSASKTYDLEVWVPSQDCYREISSCSNMTDFQARRMGVKFTNEEGNKEFVHTLNGSGLAVGRTLIGVIENYQNEDGTITVPDVLVPYMRGTHTI